MPLSRRARWAALSVIWVLAPTFAEFSSSYLASTGKPLMMAAQLLLFIPLYGFMAVIIREVAVARGLGWPGVCLLAGAFGITQAGIVDRSIFTLHGTGIEFWPEVMEPTWVASLGVSVGATVGWTLGHVIASIAAPIAMAGLVVPMSRGRRLVGRRPLVVMAGLWLAVAVVVHVEVARTYRPEPTMTQYAVIAVVAAALIVLALLGTGSRRSGDDRPDGAVSPAAPTRPMLTLAVPFAIGALVVWCADVAHLGWAATVACVLVAAGAGWFLLGWGSLWAGCTAAAVTLGAMVVRGLEAFQTPLVPGVTGAEKLGHNVVFLLLVLALTALLVASYRSRRVAMPV